MKGKKTLGGLSAYDRWFIMYCLTGGVEGIIPYIKESPKRRVKKLAFLDQWIGSSSRKRLLNTRT